MKRGHKGSFFKVEFVEDFIRANKVLTIIEGKSDSRFRRAKVFTGNDVDFWAIERQGTDVFSPEDTSDELIRKAKIHQQAFRSRRRQFDKPEQGFDHTDQIVEAAVSDIGPDWACYLIPKS